MNTGAPLSEDYTIIESAQPNPIDQDADLEGVINTANAGSIAYDLPDTAQARVLWRTGRGNYHRNGAPMVAASIEPVLPPNPDSSPSDNHSDGSSDGCFLSSVGL